MKAGEYVLLSKLKFYILSNTIIYYTITTFLLILITFKLRSFYLLKLKIFGIKLNYQILISFKLRLFY